MQLHSVKGEKKRADSSSSSRTSTALRRKGSSRGGGKMSFFTSFQELLDFDQSTNLNGFHFSNSLFGFDSNSIPGLENLPPPPQTPTLPVDHPPTNTTPAPVTTHCRRLLKTPSPVPEPAPLLETPKQCQIIEHIQHAAQTPVRPPVVAFPPAPTSNPQASPIPIVSKFQLKVTPNNEIYISNESGLHRFFVLP